ncbi:hypothetical protein Btru_021748 [Bulinus truncatus]|nr:hypothetical protein Btru_021748 [Bulinus truncatus]
MNHFNSSHCIPGVKAIPVHKLLSQSNFTASYPDALLDLSVKSLLYILAILVAILGNCMLLLTFMCGPIYRSKKNAFLANLTVVGLLVASVCMPVELIDFLSQGWPFGVFICKVKFFCQALSCIVGALTHLAVAVERFLDIFHPFRKSWSSSMICNCVVISWLLAMSISSPKYFVRDVVLVHLQGKTEALCIEIWPQYYKDKTCEVWSPIHFVYSMLVVIAMFVVPGLFTLAIYILAYYKIKNRTFPGIKSMTVAQFRQTVKEYRLYYIIAVVFYICWTPFQISTLWTASYEKMQLSVLSVNMDKIWRFITTFMAYFNSVINPVLIASLSMSSVRNSPVLHISPDITAEDIVNKESLVCLSSHAMDLKENNQFTVSDV